MRHLRIITLLPGPSKYNPDADIIGTTTNPGDSVQIRVNGTTYTVTSDSLGRFSFDIPSGVTPTSLYRFMYEQTNVETVDLTNLDTSSVTDFGDAFKGCTGLETVDTTGIDMGSVTSISNMFDGCSSLTGVTGIEDWDTSSLIYMGITFRNCVSLNSLDLSGWDTDQLTSVSSAFYGCIGLTSLDLSGWDTTGLMSTGNYTYFVPNTSSLTAYYDSSIFSSTITGTFGNVNWIDVYGDYITGTLVYNPGTFKLRINGTDYDCTVDTSANPITFRWDNPGITITSLANMSNGYWAAALSSIDLSHIDTSNVTDMSYLLWGYTKSGGIQFNFGPKFDTSNVVNMNYMFPQVTPDMQSIDLTMFDTRNVTDYVEFINSYGSSFTIYYKGSKWNQNIILFFSQRANWVDVEQ